MGKSKLDPYHPKTHIISGLDTYILTTLGYNKFWDFPAITITPPPSPNHRLCDELGVIFTAQETRQGKQALEPQSGSPFLPEFSKPSWLIRYPERGPHKEDSWKYFLLSCDKPGFLGKKEHVLQ